MEQAKFIELVLWEFNDGITTEQGKESSIKLNDFLQKQPGFISRNTGNAEDGKFLDVVYWTDLQSAKMASEKIMQEEMAANMFSTINQETMIFKHFEIFNSTK